MKNSIIPLIILIPMIIKHTNCYFMDLTGLLNPLINPRTNIAYKNNVNVNVNDNNGQFNRDRRGYNFNINHNSYRKTNGNGKNKKVGMSANLRK